MRGRLLLLAVLLVMTVASNVVYAQGSGDVLGETAIAPVPEGMSWQEYRDANRRLLPAIFTSTMFPLPGMMHFQAGEPGMGWKLAGGVALGGAAILTAAALSGDEVYKDTDYGTVDIDGIRYERIPVRVEEDGTTSTTVYQLRKLNKDPEIEGAGTLLLVSGVAVIAASYLYDWIHGIHLIQEKRDRVRYKYGQQLQYGLAPMVDPESGTVGVGFAIAF